MNAPKVSRNHTTILLCNSEMFCYHNVITTSEKKAKISIRLFVIFFECRGYIKKTIEKLSQTCGF